MASNIGAIGIALDRENIALKYCSEPVVIHCDDHTTEREYSWRGTSEPSNSRLSEATSQNRDVGAGRRCDRRPPDRRAGDSRREADRCRGIEYSYCKRGSNGEHRAQS